MELTVGLYVLSMDGWVLVGTLREGIHGGTSNGMVLEEEEEEEEE